MHEASSGHNTKRLGIDTHLYLLDYRLYTGEVKPLLDVLLAGGSIEAARTAYEAAWRILSEANDRREYPWTPFHSTQFAGDFQMGLSLFDGHVPESYHGGRTSLGILEPDAVTRDPHLVREFNCAITSVG